jgi:hypothetical protein
MEDSSKKSTSVDVIANFDESEAATPGLVFCLPVRDVVRHERTRNFLNLMRPHT